MDELRVVHSPSELLVFRLASRDSGETTFWVEVSVGDCSAKALASDFFVQSPAEFFQEMAAEWDGWQGEKSWSDYEGRFMVTASHNLVGTVWLKISLTDSEAWRVQCKVGLEPGMLAAIAKEASILFACET